MHNIPATAAYHIPRLIWMDTFCTKNELYLLLQSQKQKLYRYILYYHARIH